MTNLSQSPSDHIPTWYGEAQEARNAGDIATAQAAVERILEHDPGRPGALYLCGLLALDSNQFEAAQSWLERAIDAHPHPDFYTTLCVIQIKLNAYACALRTARQGLVFEPSSIKLRYYEAGTPISRPESRVKEVRRKQLRHFTASTARHLRSCKH